MLSLAVDHGFLSKSLVSQIILNRVLHEHTAGHWINRLLMQFFDVLYVRTYRDLVSRSDQAL